MTTSPHEALREALAEGLYLFWSPDMRVVPWSWISEAERVRWRKIADALIFGHLTSLKAERDAAHARGRAEGIREAGEWRPIATCPKDGRDFLVWNRENRVRKARWYERADSDLGISLYSSDGVNTFKGGIQPTHWTPLPAPPVLIAQSKEADHAKP